MLRCRQVLNAFSSAVTALTISCVRGGLCQAAKLVRKAGRQLAFATPRIIKEAQLAYFDKLFTLWEEMHLILFISTQRLVPLAKKHAALNLVADMSLNIFNSQTLQFWQEQALQVQCSAPS